MGNPIRAKSNRGCFEVLKSLANRSKEIRETCFTAPIIIRENSPPRRGRLCNSWQKKIALVNKPTRAALAFAVAEGEDQELADQINFQAQDEESNSFAYPQMAEGHYSVLFRRDLN